MRSTRTIENPVSTTNAGARTGSSEGSTKRRCGGTPCRSWARKEKGSRPPLQPQPLLEERSVEEVGVEVDEVEDRAGEFQSNVKRSASTERGMSHAASP